MIYILYMNILSNTLINTKYIKGLNIKPRQEKKSEKVDTNIDNYSVNDILTIFNLINVDEPTLFQIKDVANNLIARMKSEGKMEMAIFFEKAKEKVINEIERDKNENSDDTETDTDVDYDEKINSSSSLLAGDKWWENDYAIMSQESRNGRSNVENMKVSNVKMIEYEKKVILEKLKMTEIRLRELEKENKKLKNKINMMK